MNKRLSYFIHPSIMSLRCITLIIIILFSPVSVLEISKALAQDTKPPSGSKEFNKYYELGLKHYEEKKYEDAIKALNKAIEINPKSADVYFKIGRCYSRLNKLVESTKSYEKAIQINPDGSYPIYFHLGLNYYNLKDYDKAIESLQKAIKIKPDTYYFTYFSLANSYYNKKDYENAVKYLNETIKRKPDYEIAYFILSKSHQQLGNYKGAIKVLDDGLKQKPNSLTIIESLAWLLSTSPPDELRDAKRAVILAERAVDFTKGEDPIHLDTLAAAYAEAGRYQDAIKTQEKAINLLMNSQASSGIDSSLIEEFKKRLSYYKENKPWRIE